MLTISKKNVVEFKKDKKFDEVFNNFRWVLTGRENSQYSKEIFQCVYIDEKNIVCTDAKRLFIIDNNIYETPIESGLYKVVENSSKTITLVENPLVIPFPDYKKIIPDPENIKLFFECTSGFRETTLSKIFASFYKTFPKQKIFAFNPEYLKQAIGNSYKFEISVSTKEGQYNNMSPILITAEKRMALIMPICIEEY